MKYNAEFISVRDESIIKIKNFITFAPVKLEGRYYLGLLDDQLNQHLILGTEEKENIMHIYSFLTRSLLKGNTGYIPKDDIYKAYKKQLEDDQNYNFEDELRGYMGTCGYFKMLHMFDYTCTDIKDLSEHYKKVKVLSLEENSNDLYQYMFTNVLICTGDPKLAGKIMDLIINETPEGLIGDLVTYILYKIDTEDAEICRNLKV